ncbi:hypothetical protein [Serinibacter arcticus]|uniref:hypothetical protein n=1 Tax=Serinibacter arcticus TaxID=1655435 RepID=UPI0011B27E1D|nr:hypothetical protein [Serinibacter arcticus]
MEDQHAVLAAEHDRLLAGDGLAVHARALGAGVELGIGGLEETGTRAALVRPLGHHEVPRLRGDGDAVVCGRRRERAGGLDLVVLERLGPAVGRDDRDLAGAVVEERGQAVVDDDVAGCLGGDQHVVEGGLGRVVVRVVAVRLAPGAGVEERPAALRGDGHVAAVAGVGQAVEAVEREVGLDVERRGVQHEHPAVVGEGDAGVRAAASVAPASCSWPSSAWSPSVSAGSADSVDPAVSLEASSVGEAESPEPGLPQAESTSARAAREAPAARARRGVVAVVLDMEFLARVGAPFVEG